MSEYKNSQKLGIPLTTSLIIAAFSILMITVTFFMGLLSSEHNPMMPGIVGGISVIPIFCIAYAIYLLRSPVRIIVSDTGLKIEWLIKHKMIAWNEISRLDLKKPGAYQNWATSYAGKKQAASEILVLTDARGKKLAEIPNTMQEFPALMQLIRQHSTTAHGKSTFDVDEQLLKTIKSQKKNRVFMLVFGCFLLVISIAMSIVSAVSARNQKMLELQGQVADASILKHYIYNVTPRIEYSFTALDGQSYSKDVMVKKSYWETLTEGGKVPVKYVPASPGVNELLNDNTDNTDIPSGATFAACILCFLFGCGCMVMYFTNIADIKFVDGHFKVIRIGDIESNVLLDTLAPMVPSVSQAPEDEIVSAPAIDEDSVQEAAASKSCMPGGIKIIGILNIVFGAIAFLWAVGRIGLALLLVNNPDVMPVPVVAPPDVSPVILEHSLSAVLALLLAISGIGILFLKNWARLLAVTVMSLKLILALRDIVMMITPMLSQTEGLSSEQNFIVNITLAFLIVFVLAAMIYPAIVLVILLRKPARDVFKKHKNVQSDRFGGTSTT